MEIDNDDWMHTLLRCPECFQPLTKGNNHLICNLCKTGYPLIHGIPQFLTPPDARREYVFEISRYAGIAIQVPEEYDGYYKSSPIERAAFLAKRIEKRAPVLEVGPGFGFLQVELLHSMSYAVDICMPFLTYIQKKELKNTRLVQAFGERLPFPSGFFDSVVSDSVFQTLVDQREFLVEQARVLRKGGQFLLTVTYEWNYPRKPQDFPVNDYKLLIRYLSELGIDARVSFLSLPNMRQGARDDCEFMLVRGIKTDDSRI